MRDEGMRLNLSRSKTGTDSDLLVLCDKNSWLLCPLHAVGAMLAVCGAPGQRFFFFFFFFGISHVTLLHVPSPNLKVVSCRVKAAAGWQEVQRSLQACKSTISESFGLCEYSRTCFC